MQIILTEWHHKSSKSKTIIAIMPIVVWCAILLS